MTDDDKKLCDVARKMWPVHERIGPITTGQRRTIQRMADRIEALSDEKDQLRAAVGVTAKTLNAGWLIARAELEGEDKT